MIGGRQPLRGKKPGDRRVRVERPHAPYFRYTGKGVMTAKPAATAPDDRARALPGRCPAGASSASPLATDEESEERLTKKKALAIFSSDAISSSAYATEEILRRPARGGRGRVHGQPRDRHRHRDPAGRGLDQLPPDRPRLSRRRRRLRRRSQANLGKLAGARGGRRAARRLHPHGRGVDLVRRGADHLRRARRCCRAAVAMCVAVHPADDPRQPPRASGSRATSSPSRPTCSCSAPCS